MKAPAELTIVSVKELFVQIHLAPTNSPYKSGYRGDEENYCIPDGKYLKINIFEQEFIYVTTEKLT